MKKIIILTLGVILLATAISLSFKFIKSIRRISITHENMSHLPNFEFYTLDSLLFNRDSLRNSEKTVFVHFNSDCDYCISETEQLVNYIDSFKNVRILMISEESFETIRKFQHKYSLENFNQVKFLRDYNDSYLRNFGTGIIPSIILYDQNGILLKEFKGETKAETLLRILGSS